MAKLQFPMLLSLAALALLSSSLTSPVPVKVHDCKSQNSCGSADEDRDLGTSVDGDATGETTEVYGEMMTKFTTGDEEEEEEDGKVKGHDRVTKFEFLEVTKAMVEDQVESEMETTSRHKMLNKVEECFESEDKVLEKNENETAVVAAENENEVRTTDGDDNDSSMSPPVEVNTTDGDDNDSSMSPPVEVTKNEEKDMDAQDCVTEANKEEVPESNPPELNTPESNTSEPSTSNSNTSDLNTSDLNTSESNIPESITSESNIPKSNIPEPITSESNIPEPITSESNIPEETSTIPSLEFKQTKSHKDDTEEDGKAHHVPEKEGSMEEVTTSSQRVSTDNKGSEIMVEHLTKVPKLTQQVSIHLDVSITGTSTTDAKVTEDPENKSDIVTKTFEEVNFASTKSDENGDVSETSTPTSDQINSTQLNSLSLAPETTSSEENPTSVETSTTSSESTLEEVKTALKDVTSDTTASQDNGSTEIEESSTGIPDEDRLEALNDSEDADHSESSMQVTPKDIEFKHSIPDQTNVVTGDKQKKVTEAVLGEATIGSDVV